MSVRALFVISTTCRSGRRHDDDAAQRAVPIETAAASSRVDGQAGRPARACSFAIARLAVAVAGFALTGCGGGDDARAPRPSPTPVVGAAERPHCPARTLPIPPGADFGGKVLGLDQPVRPLDLRGANFDNAVLNGSDLVGRDLTGATFRGARLVSVGFSGATLTDANFEGAVFTDDGQHFSDLIAELTRTCFIGVKFTSASPPAAVRFSWDLLGTANTAGTDFSYSDILSDPDFPALARKAAGRPSDAYPRIRLRGLKVPCDLLAAPYLNGIDLADADISACPDALRGQDLSGRNFDGQNLAGFNFAGATLDGTSFRNVTFGGTSPEDPLDPFDQAGSMKGAVFSGGTFNFTTFKNLDLQGADFRGAKFFLASFQSVRLQGAHFDGSAGAVSFSLSALAGVRFDSARLKVYFPYSTFSPATSFVGASLTFDGGPVFSGADLSGVDFSGATFVNANFVGATLGDANFRGSVAPGAKFNGVVATGVHFDGATLGRSEWSGAKLESASFQGATLDGATGLNGTVAVPARLSGAKFNNTSAVGVDFSNAQLYGADFTYADLSNANFTGSFLTSGGATNEPVAAKFDGARLRNVSFASAKAQGASFVSANLYGRGGPLAPNTTCQTNVKMCGLIPVTGATCSCASMAGADLTSTDFSGAYLFGVDFANPGTVVNGTKFDDAVLVASNFVGVNLRVASGAAASFKGAMLQGANLGAGAAGLAGATLTGAYLDFESLQYGNDIQLLLGSDHTRFRNWTGAPNVCLLLGYNAPSVVPETVAFDCPDGSDGVCGRARTRAQGPNPRWASGTPLKSASPVPGWYSADSTYDRAVTDASVCNGVSGRNPDW